MVDSDMDNDLEERMETVKDLVAEGRELLDDPGHCGPNQFVQDVAH